MRYVFENGKVLEEKDDSDKIEVHDRWVEQYKEWLAKREAAQEAKQK